MKKTIKYGLIGLGLYIAGSFTYLMGYAAYSWYTSPERQEAIAKINKGKVERVGILDRLLF